MISLVKKQEIKKKEVSLMELTREFQGLLTSDSGSLLSCLISDIADVSYLQNISDMKDIKKVDKLIYVRKKFRVQSIWLNKQGNLVSFENRFQAQPN